SHQGRLLALPPPPPPVTCHQRRAACRGPGWLRSAWHHCPRPAPYTEMPRFPHTHHRSPLHPCVTLPGPLWTTRRNHLALPLSSCLLRAPTTMTDWVLEGRV